VRPGSDEEELIFAGVSFDSVVMKSLASVAFDPTVMSSSIVSFTISTKRFV